MRFRKFLKTLGIIAGLEIVTAAVGFMLFIYSAAPVFENLRTLWIETAMTTMSHQWLATAFFPQETIDSVMGKQVVDFDGIGGIDLDLEPEPEESRGPVTLVEQKEIDILGQKFLSVGGLDWAGNEILVNDIDQGIIISDIKSKNYHGWAIIVDDPSRIHMTGTTLRGDRGEQIMDFYDREDAIFACNASGFSDPGGNGSGGHVAGACMMQGELWGNYTSTYVTFGFDDQNRHRRLGPAASHCNGPAGGRFRCIPCCGWTAARIFNRHCYGPVCRHPDELRLCQCGGLRRGELFRIRLQRRDYE